MESNASNASPDKSAKLSEKKNEISINQKHKFECTNYNSGNVMKTSGNKVLKRQNSLDVTSSKKDRACYKSAGTQQTTDAIHQKIEGILHKGSDNYGNYNRVNKGIQANIDGAQTKTAHGKNIKYSKSFDETTCVNKKTQTSLENINNVTNKIPSSFSLDGTNQNRRKNNANKIEQIATEYYANERKKIATVIEEKPVSSRNRKLHLELSRDEQEDQSIRYHKQLMSALNQNKSITPTDYEEKTFMKSQYDRSNYSKTTFDYNKKTGVISSNNDNHFRVEDVRHSKSAGHSKKQTEEQTSKESKNISNFEQKKILMKKSFSMQNYSESAIENCSSYENSNYRPTTKSFSFDLEKRDKSEIKKSSGCQDFVKISKPNCDILRKQSNIQHESRANHANQEIKARADEKPLILHETKVTHPLELEPPEAIIGQGFADDRRIQTPFILRQMNEKSKIDAQNQRDICYWTTRNSRKNSASMICDESIIGKGFLDDEEFIEFYSTKQTKLKEVPEELEQNIHIPAEVKKLSPKFNLNKNEIKKYFLLHGNKDPVRANIKCEQGIYKEVPVKPIVKKVINSNEIYTNEPLHFNLNYEVPGEVQNKDQNNNYTTGNTHEKIYGKRDLNQNEYVEVGVGKAKPVPLDHHYEVLNNKHYTNDPDKIYEVPRILENTALEDDVFADEKRVKHLGEDYLNIPAPKYRKSPMLWYINDQVISFHHDIPSIVANKKISLPVSSNIRPLGFPSSTTSYYSLHNFDMHRQNPQSRKSENYTSMIRPLILG